MSVKDMTFTIVKWVFYAGSLLAALSIVLNSRGIGAGFFLAGVISLWAIMAVIALPVMAICQRKPSKNYHRLNYLVALAFTLMGVYMCISDGRQLYTTLHHWSEVRDVLYLYAINLFGTVVTGILAIVASIFLLMRNPRSHNIILAMLIVYIVTMMTKFGVLGWLKINGGIRMLPTAITIAAYFFVKRQFTEGKSMTTEVNHESADNTLSIENKNIR